MSYPKQHFEILEAATRAASDSYEILEGGHNEDTLLWEALRGWPMAEPGQYIACVINEFGLEAYEDRRNLINGSVDQQG